MGNDLDKAAKYREKAAQLREIANGIYDEKERKTLQEIAADYEQMAHIAEQISN